MAGNAPLRSANAECKTIDQCMAERQHGPSAFGLSNYCRSVAPMAATLQASSRASARPDSKSPASATVIFAGVSKSSAAEIPADVPVAPEHSPASASSRHSPSSSGAGAFTGRWTRAGAGVGHASRALFPIARAACDGAPASVSARAPFGPTRGSSPTWARPGAPLASSTVIFPLLTTRATSRALIVSRPFSGAGGSVMEKGRMVPSLGRASFSASSSAAIGAVLPPPGGGGRTALALNCVSSRGPALLKRLGRRPPARGVGNLGRLHVPAGRCFPSMTLGAQGRYSMTCAIASGL